VRLCGFESGYADEHRAREKWRGTSMAIRLNQEAVDPAQNLIKGGNRRKTAIGARRSLSQRRRTSLSTKTAGKHSRSGT
jgi:hypothetical protein